MAKKVAVKIKLMCLECGRRFTRTNPIDPACPKCGGCDVDLAYD